MGEIEFSGWKIAVDPEFNVTVFLTASNGRPGAWVKLTEDRARRELMAALDLIDPDVKDAKYTHTEQDGRARQVEILARLAVSAASTPEVAESVDLPAEEVEGRMMKLCNQGLVTKIDSQGRAGSVWSLTGDGFAAWRSGSRPDHSGGKRAA